MLFMSFHALPSSSKFFQLVQHFRRFSLFLKLFDDFQRVHWFQRFCSFSGFFLLFLVFQSFSSFSMFFKVFWTIPIFFNNFISFATFANILENVCIFADSLRNPPEVKSIFLRNPPDPSGGVFHCYPVKWASLKCDRPRKCVFLRNPPDPSGGLRRSPARNGSKFEKKHCLLKTICFCNFRL